MRVRNGDAECRAFRPSAQHHDVAAVTPRQFARDGKPQARSADAAAAGEGAKGFKMLNWHAAGANFPALADIQKLLIEIALTAALDEVGGEGNVAKQ